MTKLTSVVLGLALAAMGILGITGLMPMFQTNPAYVNIAEIILGGLGVVIGIYSRNNSKREQEARELTIQTKENSVRQRQENDQLRKENDLGIKENADRQQLENDKLRKQNEQQKQENERLTKHTD